MPRHTERLIRPLRLPPSVTRADRVLAVLAFLLAVTALLLPWWRISWDDGTVVNRDDAFALRPEPPLTTTWAPWVTGGLAAVAALVLFVRLAANSHEHEPGKWRRDLGVAAGLLLLAAASCLLWPASPPSFWGGRTYSDGGVSVTETAMPALGWWLALVAGLLAAAAFRRAGKAPSADGPGAGPGAGSTPAGLPAQPRSSPPSSAASWPGSWASATTSS